jgi:H+/Cl- antiporter ClcA
MQPGDYTPIDTLVTDYCDTDSKWGPFLFLRPARSEQLTAMRSLVLSLLPGIALGLFGSILFALIAREFDRPPLPIYVLPLVLTAAYFAACRIILAPSWNRRANLLSGRRGR